MVIRSETTAIALPATSQSDSAKSGENDIELCARLDRVLDRVAKGAGFHLARQQKRLSPGGSMVSTLARPRRFLEIRRLSGRSHSIAVRWWQNEAWCLPTCVEGAGGGRLGKRTRAGTDPEPPGQGDDTTLSIKRVLMSGPTVRLPKQAQIMFPAMSG